MIFQGPYLSAESPHSAIDGALRVLFQAVTPGARREAIAALETIMANCPQVEQPLTHHLIPGLYQREIFNPRGCVIVTQRHKEANFSHVMRGRLLIFNEEGERREIVAPASFPTYPGTKRVIVSLEDTIFTTTHPNPDNCQDIAELEKRFAEPDRKEIP